MARMLLAALGKAGYDAFLASRLISYSKRHGHEHLEQRKVEAHAEAGRLIDEWNATENRPDLWFCYHPYDKSPDWLGMEVCKRLQIPMVTAEPCKTGQGPNGEWLPWRAEAQKSIRMAEINIVMTNSDHDYLSGFIAPQHIAWLKPFIDTDLLEPTPLRAELPTDPWQGHAGCRLLTAGMMRPGAKLESYSILAEALLQIKEMDWSLVIAGGGPGRNEIEAMMAPLGERVRFAGECQPGEVLTLMEMAEVLAWPGSREAYGMVYLEAATRGTPAVALDNMGVPLVVEDGRSGLLASPPDAEHYARALARIIGDAGLRARLSSGAREFALNERNGDMAAGKLRQILDPVLAKAEQSGSRDERPST
ncbi:MAG: glycosyltransferase family 4 protein [Nitratireductor sp.]